MAAGIAMTITWACALVADAAWPTAALSEKVAGYQRRYRSSRLLNAGEFETPTKGLTVFIRQMNNNGQINGILVDENRPGPLVWVSNSPALSSAAPIIGR